MAEVLQTHIFDLPREVHMKLLSFMNASTRAKMARTCRYFRRVLKEFNETRLSKFGPPLSPEEQEELDMYDHDYDYDADSDDYDYDDFNFDEVYDSDVSGI